jgi:thiol:disulfide interchange protein
MHELITILCILLILGLFIWMLSDIIRKKLWRGFWYVFAMAVTILLVRLPWQGKFYMLLFLVLLLWPIAYAFHRRRWINKAAPGPTQKSEPTQKAQSSSQDQQGGKEQ